MLYLYTGTDRKKSRAEMNAAVARASKHADVVRITDANSIEDLSAALQGGGMFGGKRTVVLDGVFANEEMRSAVLAAISGFKASGDIFLILEEKVDAQTRRAIEKYAEKSERFDAAKGKREEGIFALAMALKRGDRKSLWVGYQRALARDEAPEAIHGVLFWGAKDMCLKARTGSIEQKRAKMLVAQLAELPHEARRRSVEFEYALERYILGLPTGQAGINKT